MLLYDEFKGMVLYDKLMGFVIYEENGRSAILDNRLYSITEEQLHLYLDEKLAFMSYLTESLLNIYCSAQQN